MHSATMDEEPRAAESRAAGTPLTHAEESRKQLTPPDTNVFTITALLQCTLCCFQLFIVGSTFSLSVFTVPVEQSANPAASLDGVWATSMGLIHFLSAPVTILASVFLEEYPSLSPSARLCVLHSVTSISLAIFSLSAFAVALNSTILIALSVCLFACPLAISTFFFSSLFSFFFFCCF